MVINFDGEVRPIEMALFDTGQHVLIIFCLITMRISTPSFETQTEIFSKRSFSAAICACLALANKPCQIRS